MDLLDSKSLLASKTFWGAIVMLASTASMFLKVDLGDSTIWINSLTGLAGSIIAIIGRIKAVKRIE